MRILFRYPAFLLHDHKKNKNILMTPPIAEPRIDGSQAEWRTTVDIGLHVSIDPGQQTKHLLHQKQRDHEDQDQAQWQQ